MKITFILAWRNLWRNKRRSLITMSSVLFAVLLAILFSSLEQGSYERMIDNMVRYSTGYIQIQDVLFEEEPSMDNSLLYGEEVSKVLDTNAEDIAYTIPRIQNFALVSAGSMSRGAMVMGIEPESEDKINNLSDRLIKGDFLNVHDHDILLAEGLAGILNVDIGDSLILLGQGFQGTTASGIYRIKGILNLNVPDINDNFIYMALPEAQWFYGAEDRLTSLVVMPVNPKRSKQLIERLSAGLDPEWYRVLSWEDLLKDLLALMKFDIAGSMVMLGILYMVIAFGLFGTMLTMLLERKKEHAMLCALGMKRSRLAGISFMESILLSLAGALAGILIAIPIVAYFYHYPIQLSGGLAETMIEYGFEPIMPLSADPQLFLNQARLVLIISVMIGLYPVYSIFKMNIIKAKNE